MEPENPYDPIDSPLLHAAWALGHQTCQASLEEELYELDALRDFQRLACNRYLPLHQLWDDIHG